MQEAVSIKNVSKNFGAKKALDHVSLTIPENHIFGFLGPNGAGKTTMIRCLMDYIRPSCGEITIFGKSAHEHSQILKRTIGYLSSDSQLHPNWTAKTHIDFMANIKGLGRANELIDLFGLDQHTKVQHLSSGNKQKLAIVLAFLGNPKLLIMDEPTRGLDPLLQNELYRLLRDFVSTGGTVFFSSHNLPEVETLCNSVAIIKNGKIITSQAMQDILQLRVHVIQVTTNENLEIDDFKSQNIEIINASPRSMSLKVRGDIDSVIKKLSAYEVKDLDVTHLSLEDIFLEYY